MKRVGGGSSASVASEKDYFKQPTGGLASANNVSIPEAYPFRLNTYLRPPTYDITIDLFEELAFARLQLLRAVDAAAQRNQRDDDLFRSIRQAEDKWMPLHANESAASYDLEEERRRDQASHFILRLAYCTSAENIRWFVNQEVLLFKSRFHNELAREKAEFLKRIAANLTLVEPEEKTEFAELMQLLHPGRENEEFYKVMWEDVPDLVAKAAVVLCRGYAYVPKYELFSLLVTQFRANLEFWMERTGREVPNLGDERLVPLLQAVKSTDSSVATDITRGFVEVGKLTAADMDSASVHFPLCMRQLFDHAKSDNHLKYNGRQQFGLFLKGIGLTLDEAVAWWRKVFVPKSGEEGFNKNYMYNIRHNYGQEGKRANYGPQSCSKIITGPAPSVGDHHGCPFRHASQDALQKMLSNSVGPSGVRLEPARISEILDLARSNQCQSACTRFYEHSRGMIPNQLESFSYPSKYFEASVKQHNKSSVQVKKS